MKTNKFCFKKKVFSDNGFSLLELMIVIALMALLVVGGYSAYIASLKRGRDVRRKQDMKVIQNAFEQYYTENFDYPINDSEAEGTLLGDALLSDPKNSAPYVYTYGYAGDGFGYCVCSLLENSGEGNADAPDDPSTNSCNLSSNGNYFCVENLQ